MTTFVKNSIPASIDSVEKLVIWGCCVLQELYPTVKVTENIEEAPHLVAQVGGYDLPIPTDDNWTYQVNNRVVGRVSIPLTTTWKRTRLYLAAQDLGASATPAAYYE
jgi:hypothetical protein